MQWWWNKIGKACAGCHYKSIFDLIVFLNYNDASDDRNEIRVIALKMAKALTVVKWYWYTKVRFN